MRVDLARARQSHSGKLRLHALQHGVDRFVTIGGEERIDVAAVVRPGAGDHLSPPLRIGLIPGFDVAVDQRLRDSSRVSPFVVSPAVLRRA